MTAHPPKALRHGLACLLAGLALPAGAIGLGELRVQSSLGEPFDATVDLATPSGAPPRADCFSLGRERAGGLPAVSRATFAVEPDGTGWRVRIRTRTIVAEPALLLRVNASCEGKEAASRDYTVLLDPRAAKAPPPAFSSLPGDTLASVAAAIYPNRPSVREAYGKALRVANPTLAALAPDEAIPPGTRLVLPDLRRFSLSLAVSPLAPRPSLPVVTPRAPVAQSPTPAPPPARAQPPQPAPRQAASPRRPPAAPPPALAKAPKTLPAPKAAIVREPPPARAPMPPGSGKFVLRLSAPEVDLSRSRGVDDRTRMRLRERLLVLDADDQVAALLAMRSSLHQLEGRVAELQLKLSTLSSVPPATFRPAPAPSPPVAAITTPPAPVSAPAPTPPVATIAPPPPVATVAPSPPAPASPPTPAPSPSVATAAPPSPAIPPAAKPAPAPAMAPAPVAKAPATAPGVPAGPAGALGLAWWLWGVVALVVAAIGAIAWRVLSRPRQAIAAPAAPASGLDEASAMMSAAAETRAVSAASPPAREHRVVADSDAGLATGVRGADPATLRRRYIEERFPEITSGTIAPDNADSVLKAARLFYEDGALARAVELLHFAVEENPAELKPWLGLFEIFRLEGLRGEFGELAARFRAHHGASDYWQKVQHIGREMDPRDPLYRESAAGGLETVGAPARSAAAPLSFDPLAENWLNAPMDFTTVALAASLRAGILADAGVSDADLVANPMPALKNIEMFNIA